MAMTYEYSEKQKDLPWLDGYNLETLKRLYKLKVPVEQNENEEYKSYFEYANKNYSTYKILNEYKNILPELLVSNYGNVIINGDKIQSTLVKDGPNKCFNDGKDNYKEIVFPKMNLKNCIFTYRLVAEVWCNNPDTNNYTTVHHIGNDNYDIKNNLIFVTPYQHGLIHGFIKNE
jgi:hypothetical protein